jgi:hypothetical protein
MQNATPPASCSRASGTEPMARPRYLIVRPSLLGDDSAADLVVRNLRHSETSKQRGASYPTGKLSILAVHMTDAGQGRLGPRQ